jgi:hypothetical protein
MNNMILWDIMWCSLILHYHIFSGTSCLHLHSRGVDMLQVMSVTISWKMSITSQMTINFTDGHIGNKVLLSLSWKRCPSVCNKVHHAVDSHAAIIKLRFYFFIPLCSSKYIQCLHHASFYCSMRRSLSPCLLAANIWRITELSHWEHFCFTTPPFLQQLFIFLYMVLKNLPLLFFRQYFQMGTSLLWQHIFIHLLAFPFHRFSCNAVVPY